MAPLGLRAVKPQWELILDDDSEGVGGLAAGGGLEAGEDGVVGDGDAGLGEGGLRERVVHRVEVDLDQVADLGDDILGLEVQAVETGEDTVGGAALTGDDGRRGILTGCGGGKGGSEGGSAEKSDGGEGNHVDYF